MCHVDKPVPAGPDNSTPEFCDGECHEGHCQGHTGKSGPWTFGSDQSFEPMTCNIEWMVSGMEPWNTEREYCLHVSSLNDCMVYYLNDMTINESAFKCTIKVNYKKQF